MSVNEGAQVVISMPRMNRAEVWVDGVKVDRLTNIEFRHRIGEVPTLHLEQLVTSDAEIRLGADVHVSYTHRWLILWPWLTSLGAYVRRSLQRPL